MAKSSFYHNQRQWQIYFSPFLVQLQIPRILAEKFSKSVAWVFQNSHINEAAKKPLFCHFTTTSGNGKLLFHLFWYNYKFHTFWWKNFQNPLRGSFKTRVLMKYGWKWAKIWQKTRFCLPWLNRPKFDKISQLSTPKVYPSRVHLSWKNSIFTIIGDFHSTSKFWYKYGKIVILP